MITFPRNDPYLNRHIGKVTGAERIMGNIRCEEHFGLWQFSACQDEKKNEKNKLKKRSRPLKNIRLREKKKKTKNKRKR